MIELAKILQRFGPEYKKVYAGETTSDQLKTIWAIEHCRTEVMGGHLFRCQECDDLLYSYHSCKNRHCPKCGNDNAERWLTKQFSLLLPENYHLVTFTLPHHLLKIVRYHQETIYRLLFKASSESLKKLALDPKFVGGQIGMVGVLHTWTRDLRYHPHVHYIVPGAGLTDDGEWIPADKRFLLPVKALSKIFKAKLRDLLQKHGFLRAAQHQAFKKNWVVHSKPVGSGKAALKYLAPYVYRVALTNNRIEKVENEQVTFRYRESDSGSLRKMTLPAIEFIRRFLQHVLPKGFHKIRYYGLLSPVKRDLLQRIKRLLVHRTAFDVILNTQIETSQSEQVEPTNPKVLHCKRCGGILKLVMKIYPYHQRAPPIFIRCSKKIIPA